jgi:hypothetical protein
MDEPENRFIRILEENKFLGGIYFPPNSDPNIEIYNWFQINIDSFFNSELLDFKNKTPKFYFIQSYGINGCYFLFSRMNLGI